MEAVFNIVSYLSGNHNSGLALDPTYPGIDHALFNNHKWVDFYSNVKEAIPPNITDPRGNDTDLIMCVDINHAGDKSTFR